MRKRKAARSLADVSSGLKEQLEAGQTETAGLMEYLATDRLRLLKNCLEALGRAVYYPKIEQAYLAEKKLGLDAENRLFASALYEQAHARGDKALFGLLAKHRSDIVRAWAVYYALCAEALSPEEQLRALVPFAADAHFSVREYAWMALRPALLVGVEPWLELLHPWAQDEDENIRRFALELTRPRGVWCKHIQELKARPKLALPLLEQYKDEQALYVQKSLGNWLNDASKSHPQFVKALCQSWLEEKESKARTSIAKRALRSLHRAEKSKK